MRRFELLVDISSYFELAYLKVCPPVESHSQFSQSKALFTRRTPDARIKRPHLVRWRRHQIMETSSSHTGKKDRQLELFLTE